jgi:HD-GYP domain-containing protein (c-di-GMP phosphodiesterase class II)
MRTKKRQADLPAHPYSSQKIPAENLATLLKVSSNLASTLDLAEVLQIAIESAVHVLGLDTGAIYTLDRDSLYLGATTPPLPTNFPEELRAAHLDDHPHLKKAVLTRGPVCLRDARTEDLTPAERTVVESRRLVTILYFPLLLRDEVIGVFIVGTTGSTRQLTGEEIDLCYILAYQVSLAIENAHLYQKAQTAAADLMQAYDSTLEGWSQMIDMRDRITVEHTRRVVARTLNLAGRMAVPESEMIHIRRGALLHDIGKVGIPDAILQKPAALSDDEMTVMRTHPVLAHQILSNISYLSAAMEIPYCHHERWDGSGYPRGLKGEDIPLAARIFSVVDVYDALTSDRLYRKAWKPAAALAYIQEHAGTFFCPEVVAGFLEMMSGETKDQPAFESG